VNFVGRKFLALLFFAICFSFAASAEASSGKKFYRSNGAYLAIQSADSGELEIYHSDDGVNFLPLEIVGSTSGSEDYLSISLEDPLDSKRPSRKIEIKNGKVLEGETSYTEVELDPTNLRFYPFPSIRVARYLFKDAAGRYIFLSQDEFPPYQWHFFTGLTEQTLSAVGVIRVIIAGDGSAGTPKEYLGTRWVNTVNGVLYIPEAYRKESDTWLGKPIQRLNLRDFQIIQNTDGTVTVKPLV